MFADAIRAAKRSTIYRHRTGCALYDSNGNLLSIGWSHRSESTLVATPFSKHSEHHAIERLPKRDRHLVHTVVIATLTKANRLTSAKPCPACALKLSKLPNIKQISHTEYLSTGKVK